MPFLIKSKPSHEVKKTKLMVEQEKTNKMNKSEILAYLLWAAFGIIGTLHYYSEKEYWISGIMALLGVFMLINLWNRLSENEKDTL
jgi:predicted branched-subunit amino acid permease